MALAPDQEGALLREVLTARGGSQPVLDAINHFYQFRLPEILGSFHIQTNNGLYATFSNPLICRPSIRDLRGGAAPRPLYPFEARRSRLSYMGELHCKLELKQLLNGQYVPVPGQSVDVYLGNIPVAVGSYLCRTYGLSPEERYQRGEPKRDPQGYFIIKGDEKVLLNIEKLRTLTPFIYEEKEKYMVRYTSQTLTDTSVVIVFEDRYDLHVTFTKMGISNNSINIFYIFYALGLTRNTIEEVYRIMESFIVDEDPVREARRRREMRYFMQTTENTFRSQTNLDERRIFDILAGKFKDPDIKNSDRRNFLLHKVIQNELFKNISLATAQTPEEQTSLIIAKIRLLASMAAKYVDFRNGYRSVDDRDAWGNKKLADASEHLMTRFVQIWKQMITNIQAKVKGSGLTTAEQIKGAITPRYMTEQFINSFIKKSRGSNQGTREVTVVETLKRDNIVAAWSHIRRISTPTNRRAQIREKRLIHNTQWGVACPVMTPEGEACLHELTTITRADGSETTIGELKDGDEVLTINPITLEQSASKITKHFIKSSAEYGKPILKITSFNGREIICTDDHPFLTQYGWVYAKDLNPQVHLLAIYPGVKPLPHVVAERKAIFNEQTFKEKLHTIGVKPSLIEKHALELKKKGFFPLMNDDRRLVTLARIAGFLLADGNLSLNGEGIPSSSYCFGTSYDGELFFQDMEKLGFHRNTLSYVERSIIDKETGREATHHVWVTSYSGCFASLLLALGLTYGKRVEKASNPVPDWIMNGSPLVKREFVAGFQGGDGSKITWNKVKAGKFNLSRTMQHKVPEHADSLMIFMNQIAQLMRELGIDVLRVWQQPESEKRVIVRIDISDAEENLLKYMEIIGYRYATTKNTESLQLTEYIRYKQSKIEERVQFKEKVKNLTREGLRPAAISKQLGCTLRQVSSVLEYQGNGGTLAPKDTIGVEEWLARTFALNNCVFMPIKSITPDAPCMVADFTTVSDNHSMISNGFVTHNCGLIKDSAVTVYVSLERDESLVRARIDGHYALNPVEGRRNPLYLNGVPIGYCNSRELRDELIRLRRSQQLYFDTGIILDQYNELWIYTNSGRVCRPLLVVDPASQQLLIDLVPGMRGADLATLMSNGVLEYIDVAEQEQTQIFIAETTRHLTARRERIEETIRVNQERLNDPRSTPQERQAAQAALSNAQAQRKYTHCEVDPTAILGLSAITMPFSEFNPGPRDTYQAAMVRQALGPNASRIELRFDSTMRTMIEPGVPVVTTDAHELLGLDEYPQGQQLILAITTYGGQNQEDAIIFNKDAIDRGLFMMMIYHSYTVTISQSKTHQERIQIPDYPQSQRLRYSKLDPETGIVRVGETVQSGDCLVGRVIIDTATGKVKNGSLYLEVGKQGVVDEVFITENTEASRLIRIRIRELRKPQPGDKLASRYSQKGTIGAILPGKVFPWIVSKNRALNGVRPHAIFNPHSVPSRMTIGKLYEILTGKLAVLKGERVSATAFRRFNIENIQEELANLGFTRSGKERMVNGITGREMDVDIYVGPIYYQLLRHLVGDKMRARGTGAIQFLTRQPNAGIRKEGGLRLGEMERDALIEYGAAYLTQERMNISSDAWQGVFCRRCGQISINNVERGTFGCRSCREYAEFTRVQIPYSFKLMTQLLAAAGVKVTLGTKEV